MDECQHRWMEIESLCGFSIAGPFGLNIFLFKLFSCWLAIHVFEIFAFIIKIFFCLGTNNSTVVTSKASFSGCCNAINNADDNSVDATTYYDSSADGQTISTVQDTNSGLFNHFGVFENINNSSKYFNHKNSHQNHNNPTASNKLLNQHQSSEIPTITTP